MSEITITCSFCNAKKSVDAQTLDCSVFDWLLKSRWAASLNGIAVCDRCLGATNSSSSENQPDNVQNCIPVH